MRFILLVVLDCQLCADKVFQGLNGSAGSLVVEMGWRLPLRGFERVEPLFHLAHRRAQRRRLLQIGFGLLQRALKLRQGSRKGSGLQHDLNRRQPLSVHLGEHRVVDGQRTERRIARRQGGNIAVNRAGMKIPARVLLDAIDDVLLVHHQIVVRVNVTPDVVGIDDFRIANGRAVRCWRRLLWSQCELGRGGTRREKYQRNEMEWFHRLGVVEGCSSVSSAKPAPPNVASARSMVCRT